MHPCTYKHTHKYNNVVAADDDDDDDDIYGDDDDDDNGDDDDDDDNDDDGGGEVEKRGVEGPFGRSNKHIIPAYQRANACLTSA